MMSRKNPHSLALISFLLIGVGITIVVGIGVFAAVDPTLGLLGYWNFDEGSGVVAEDHAATNDGDLINTPTWTTGKFNSGLLFDGSTNYVSMDSSLSTGTDPYPFSVALWFNATSLPSANATLWSLVDVAGGSDTNNNIEIRLTASGQVQAIVEAGIATASTTVTTGGWHQAVAVFTSSTSRMIYLDGGSSGNSTANRGVTNLSKSSVGARILATPDNYFNGVIDDLQIFDHVLTAQDVADLYIAYPPEILPDSPVISNGSPSGALPAGTDPTLHVETDISSSCRYSTTPDTEYDAMTNTFTTTGGTIHEEPLSGLSNGAYNYYVRCDNDGAVNNTDYTLSFIIGPSPEACITESSVSFPTDAPWGLTEAYARRARGEAAAKPTSIDTRNGTYAWTGSTGFFDTAQPDMMIFKDTQCGNANDYSFDAGGREYVRITNAIGQNSSKPGNYGPSVSYGTDQPTFSQDGKWLSITNSGKCIFGVSSCSSSTAFTQFYPSDGKFARSIRYQTVSTPNKDYNFGWGRGANSDLLYWTTDTPTSNLDDLFVTNFSTGATSIEAEDLFTNASHGSNHRKIVRSPETAQGTLLITDIDELGVDTTNGWQSMGAIVDSVTDGPEGTNTRITFSGAHGLLERDRLRMQGPPDITCSGDSTCDDIGERRVVKTIVNSTTVDIDEGQFADYTDYASDTSTPVDVTGFTLKYNRFREKVFIYDVVNDIMDANYFVDIGLTDDSGTVPAHQRGEEYRMHSFGMSQTGNFWGGSYGAFLSTGESIPWKFPVTGTDPDPSEVQLLGKSPCTPGSWPYFGHSAFGPIADQVLVADGTDCGVSTNDMSIWAISTETKVKEIKTPDEVGGILHARWQSRNKYMYASYIPEGESNTNRMLMRCDTDASEDHCETIARGYVGDTASSDAGSIRPKSSPDATKVLLNTSEFNGRGSGSGFNYRDQVDVFYAVSFMPIPPSTTTADSSGVLSWSIPTIPLNGSDIPLAEVRGYHIYESADTTSGNCQGPWTRLTTSSSSATTYDISSRVPNGQGRCYAITTEENSTLESDTLGNRLIVSNSGGTYSNASGGASGTTNFDSSQPETPAVVIDSLQSVYGVSNNYVNGLTFTPSDSTDTRYYNLYYFADGKEGCDQSTLFGSIPATAIDEFATSGGDRPFFDYLADPTASDTFYGITAVDRAGNESFCAYSDGSTSATDTIDPSVSITSPDDDTEVAGTITVSATASDNIAVAGVQFKLDGDNIGSEDTSYPYSINWDSNGASDGTHTITALARDTSNNTTTSSGVTIYVLNNAPIAPSNLAGAVVSTSRIDWSWTNNGGSDNYRVVDASSEQAVSPLLAGSATSWSETGLNPNVAVTRKVAAINAAGTSYSSALSKTTLSSPPGSLSLDTATTSSVKLSWTSGGAQSGYKLFRNGNSNSGTLIYSGSVTTFTDTGLSAGTTYSYYLYSYNSVNILQSSYASISATTTEGPADEENHTPVLAPIGAQSIVEGLLLTFEVHATDEDDDALTFTTVGDLPAGATFTDNGDGSGVFRWTPSSDQAGNHQIQFFVSDGTDSDTESITITVHSVEEYVPIPTIVSPRPEEIIKTGKPLFTGLSLAKSDVFLIVDGKILVVVKANEGRGGVGDFHYHAREPIASGWHTLIVRARLNGTTSRESSPIPFYIDAPFITPTLFNPILNSDQSKVRITGLAGSESLIHVYRNDKEVVSIMTSTHPSGTSSFSVEVDLPVGKHIIELQAEDANGKLSNRTTPLHFTRTNGSSRQTIQSGQDLSYIVQPGDSLWRIAQQFYGSGIFWQVIINANSGILLTERYIFPGMVLTIPAR